MMPRASAAHRRRLSTPGGVGKEAQQPPPVVAAEGSGSKVVAEGAAPPLPEVPVLEAPAGASLLVLRSRYDVSRGERTGLDPPPGPLD